MSGASEATSSSKESTFKFTPLTIRPFTKAGKRKSSKVVRKKRKTAILTDTPEKQALENEQRAKQNKNTNHSKGCKRLSFKRKTQKTRVKKSIRQDYFCLVCAEPFSNSRMGEQWIQCSSGCGELSHVQCVPSGPTYTCHYCDLDDSDYIH